MPRRATARQLLDLSGVWKAHPVDSRLLRVGADPDLDDSNWTELTVPGHWTQQSEFEHENGPMLYRRRFALPAGAVNNANLSDDGSDNNHNNNNSSRYWLRLDGVMSEAEVWLDGKYLGDTIGYFASQQFEVTELLRAGREHLVALDVRCRPPEPRLSMVEATDDGPRDKTALTGSLQVGPLAPPINPGGLWQPVAIDVTGPVAIRHARLLCTRAGSEEAAVSLRLVLDSKEATEVQLRAVVAETDQSGSDSAKSSGSPPFTLRSQPLAKGENRIEWTVPIQDPKLWWPTPLGDQPLYQVDLSVEMPGTRHAVSDQVTWRTGLRTVSTDDMLWQINDQRMFIKCLAYGPAHPHLATMSVDDLRRDLDLAMQAGFNAIRPVAHLAPPQLLDLADELGLLVWQDLPLIGGYSSKTQRSVKALIREAVDAVGHHPSVFVWGGHCQPNGEAVARPSGDSITDPARQIVRHLLPSWNRSFLDSIVGRELAAADPTRPAIPRSGHLPSRLDPSTDSRLWLGWRTGRSEDAAAVYQRWPRLASFPSGIGAQTVSLPSAAEDDNWITAEFGSLSRYVNPHHFEDFQSWAVATQQYQRELIRRQIEAVRLKKYNPSGGFVVTALADAEPWGGFGLVHVDRSPKPSFYAAALANRPVLPVLAEPPASVRAQRTVDLPVHLLNDLFYGLESVEVTAVALAPEGQVIAEEQWTVDAPADGAVEVGVMSFAVPRIEELAVHLAVVEGGSTTESIYDIPVSL